MYGSSSRESTQVSPVPCEYVGIACPLVLKVRNTPFLTPCIPPSPPPLLHSELEQYVDALNRESSVAGGSRAVTLKDVEEGAVSLRRVGESLAGLKGRTSRHVPVPYPVSSILPI